MPNSPIPDPMQMWRDAIGTFEKQVNALANQSMNSEQFAAALHQVAGLSMGMDQTYKKLLGAYFKQLGLPTREDVHELSAAVKRVEDKLDALIATQASEPAVPRPARTRRPPEESRQPAESGASPGRRRKSAP